MRTSFLLLAGIPLQAALDPYLFVREGFLQQRKHLIYDGYPLPESLGEFADEGSVQNEATPEPL